MPAYVAQHFPVGEALHGFTIAYETDRGRILRCNACQVTIRLTFAYLRHNFKKAHMFACPSCHPGETTYDPAHSAPEGNRTYDGPRRADHPGNPDVKEKVRMLEGGMSIQAVAHTFGVSQQGVEKLFYRWCLPKRLEGKIAALTAEKESLKARIRELENGTGS